MPSRHHAISEFIFEEDAATAVEYAVMLALIIVACIGSVSFLATQTAGSFDSSADAIAGAVGP
jgi:pilus assembly protein Flp/PilA